MSVSLPAELGIRTWLAAAFPSCRVVTETPSNLATVLPLIHVERIGGAEFEPTIDDARMDVAYFGATRDAAAVGAEAVRIAMLWNLPGQTVGGSVVLSVATLSAPVWTPYDNTTLRRFDATYQVRLKTTH